MRRAAGSGQIWAATEAKSLGYGGQKTVAVATGISQNTINKAMKEIKAGFKEKIQSEARIRKSGGGRKKIIEKDKSIINKLEELVEPATRGEPDSPLKWTCKSVRQLAAALNEAGYKISRQKVDELLKELGYSLQSNRKTKEGSSNPDRDKQFNFIYNEIKELQLHNQPVISVDTKKKELIGEFKNNGREWYPKGKAAEVNIYDFIGEEGKINPYGIYDQTNNSGWVSVGTDHDTAEFAVESIRRWWWKMGCQLYPDAKELLITADSGGSNGYKVRLWKIALQKLADELKIGILISHLPPGTSKWNKIEHSMFSFISENWRSRPLISYEVVVKLIENTTNTKGLKIKAELDTNKYEIHKKIKKSDYKKVNLIKNNFHGEWNYTIFPHNQ
jgi:transposase